MANRISVPSMARTQKSMISGSRNPEMPTIDFRSGLKDVGTAIQNTADFTETYTKLRYEQYQAKMQNLEMQQLHEMEDASDPCELEEINKKYEKAYNTLLGDDYFTRSYYKSRFYQNWQTQHQANQQKAYLAKQHEFEDIQAVATLNEMASTMALYSDPRDMHQILKNGEAMLDGIGHMTAKRKFELMSAFYEQSVGKLMTANPNAVITWLDYAGNSYDEYGLDSNALRQKVSAYNKALESEKRIIENFEYTKKQREQTAKINYYKSQILQNPNMTESILSKALLEDDKIYVDLFEFVKNNTPKSSQRSQMSKDFTKAYAEGGVKGAEDFIKNNPNAVNDPNTMTAYENVKKINKSESDADALLKEMQDAFSEGKYKDFRTKHLAEILITDKTRSADTAYRNELNLSSNADGYTIRIANSSDIGEITDIADEALSDASLTNKDKTSIAKYRNTRISQIENKADKKETKIQKQQKEKITEESAKAYGEILSEQNNGSEAIKNKFKEVNDKLTMADKNKAIALYNKTVKEEGKEQKDLLKEAQEANYNELMGLYRKGNLSQEKIDDAFEKGNISIEHKEKLEQTLFKAEIKQAEQTEKDNKEQALKTIYNADVNGETVDVSKLPSQDADVIKAANSVNLKNGKRVYTNEKNNIFGEMLDNSMPDDEVIEGWKNRLIEKNYLGNTELPEQWIENTLTSIRGIEQSKASFVKSKIDTLFGKPINGKSFSEYETSLKDLAYKEALKSVVDGKTPNFEEIYKNHKPTKEGLSLYYQTRDNAYYGQLGIRDNIFEKRTITEGDSEDKVQSSYYLVKKGVKASQYIDYIKTIENNREEGYYTDAQYKELFKPVAINKGYILNTLAEENIKTVEGRVARKLKEINGNKIGNPNDFYEDFWNCISFVEGKGEERSDRYNPWFFDEVEKYVVEWYKTTKAQAPNTISE